MINLKGKIAIITGASSGIGRAIAELMAARDAIVIGTATSKTGANKISTYLGNSGKGMELNFYNIASIKNFVDTINKEFGDVDILINNAGITHDSLLIRMKDKEWQSIIDINLTSVFRITKIIIPAMLKKRYGRIIQISSIVGYMGNIGQTNYAAAKAGLTGFSKSLAREVASRGITVNLVAPGFITTNMTNLLTEKKRTCILSKIPANRFGNPKEIASIVAFLASDEAAYITGETIHVNGGMYMI